MTRSRVVDLTVDELRDLVREVVIQTLLEMLGDPDEGLELRDDLAAELEAVDDRLLRGIDAHRESVDLMLINALREGAT